VPVKRFERISKPDFKLDGGAEKRGEARSKMARRRGLNRFIVANVPLHF